MNSISTPRTPLSRRAADEPRFGGAEPAGDAFGASHDAGDPRFAVCVTTMNRTAVLAACLDALARCMPRASCIVVSDDSPDPVTRRANQSVVDRHPGVVYLEGPHRGVCANRNHAVRHCLAHAPECDYVSFVDDDIEVDRRFFAAAHVQYAMLAPGRRSHAILTGGTSGENEPDDCRPVQLSFNGYFQAGDKPKCVNIHSAVFPLAMFQQECWDENIFFGTEDAELSLRALQSGYSIELAPRLRTRDTMPGAGVLHEGDASGKLTKYQLNCEAARLYIGVKRYLFIEPNLVKCAAFVMYYFPHLFVHLAKRGALSQFLPIIRKSNVWRAFAAR